MATEIIPDEPIAVEPEEAKEPVAVSVYYLPDYDASIEANSLEEAIKLAETTLDGR